MGGEARGFPHTRWELVTQLWESGATPRRNALEELCRLYWYPIYRHLRIGEAKSNDDAKDLTQAFLLWLLEGDALRRYAPEKGTLRTYLKVLLRRFVDHREEAMRALKRGGNVVHIPLADLGEDAVPDAPAGADGEFDAAWRRRILAHAVARVREQFESSDRGVQMRVFERFDLAPEEQRPSYAQAARELGLKEDDVRNYLHRVREAVRAQVRLELRDTVAGPEQLEEEWNAFLAG